MRTGLPLSLGTLYPLHLWTMVALRTQYRDYSSGLCARWTRTRAGDWRGGVDRFESGVDEALTAWLCIGRKERRKEDSKLSSWGGVFTEVVAEQVCREESDKLVETNKGGKVNRCFLVCPWGARWAGSLLGVKLGEAIMQSPAGVRA